MSMDTANFSQQLRALPTLVKTLAEDQTHKLKVSPTGQLSVLRGTRWTASKTQLDAQAIKSLADAISDNPIQAMLGPWFLRALPGARGKTILGERRLTQPEFPVHESVHEELLHQARLGSTGVIAGGIGSTKGSLLLWLASQLGRRELVLVSDVPPREMPSPAATHVFPPSNERERRDLGRLLRVHDCIFWEGIDRADDLVTLMSTPNSHNRWFTMDARDGNELARRLRQLGVPLAHLQLDSCVFIGLDADATPVISSLARHEADGWTELLSNSLALVEALDSINEVFASQRPLPRESAPAPAPTPEASRPAAESAAEGQPAPADVDAEPEVESSGDEADGLEQSPSEAGIITPKKVKSGAYKAAPKPSRDPDQPPEEPTATSAPTELQGISLDELLRSDEIDREELLRQSGEIDLQSFIEAREYRKKVRAAREKRELREEAQADQQPDADEAPPSFQSAGEPGEAVTDIASGAEVDAMLAEMSEKGGKGSIPGFPDVDPSKLTPPVSDETTALTPVDMDRIRESVDDEISTLIADSEPDEEAERSIIRDDGEPSEPSEPDQGRTQRHQIDELTRPAHSVYRADPAPTHELSRNRLERNHTDAGEQHPETSQQPQSVAHEEDEKPIDTTDEIRISDKLRGLTEYEED